MGFSGIANNAVTRLDTPKGEPPAYGEHRRLLRKFVWAEFFHNDGAVFQ